MNHSIARPQLSAYLEGDLAPPDRAGVDRHVAGCEDCARELHELRQTVALLRGLPTPEPPPFLATRVMARIADGEGRSSAWRRWLDQAAAPWIAAPFAAAMAALVVFTVAGPPSPTQVAAEAPDRLVPQMTGSVAATRTQGGPQIASNSTRAMAPKIVFPGSFAKRLRGAGHPNSAELAGHFEADVMPVAWQKLRP